MSASPDDEATLVECAIAGDTDAFGRLYLLHLDAIYRYIYFRVGDVHEAEDLTEQVFVRAWEALPRYQARTSPFSSWLYRIAHNLIVDYHRRRHIQPVPLLEEQGHESREAVAEAAALEQVIRAEEMHALAQAVAQLTEAQQQVLVLRFVEGLSHDKIARIVNKSQQACRVIQHRALIALNRILQAGGDDKQC